MQRSKIILQLQVKINSWVQENKFMRENKREILSSSESNVQARKMSFTNRKISKIRLTNVKIIYKYMVKLIYS